jgi:hypothetical protein
MYTIPRFKSLIKTNSENILLRPGFFEERESKALGVTVKTVKPMINFYGNEIELRYNVGTRGNAVDQPKWPADLRMEIVM